MSDLYDIWVQTWSGDDVLRRHGLTAQEVAEIEAQYRDDEYSVEVTPAEGCRW